MTEDRELTPRQVALVDALTTRLWSGMPMNEHDLTAALMVANAIGLQMTGAHDG